MGIESKPVSRGFKQVDVFASRPCFGNPLAVVIDAEGLKDSDMQRLAQWTNLSETVFILNDPDADYLLRIFTPDREIPFAGHPVIGAARAAIEAGMVDGTGPFKMRCGLGFLNMRIEGRKIWVTVPPPEVLKIDIDQEMLAEALSGQNPAAPLVFDTGPIWMVSRFENLHDLDHVRIKREILTALSRNTVDAVGLILYAVNQENGVDVRAFAPAIGVDEDPVCGSGNIAVAGHLKETGMLDVTGERYQARQGRHLGRDGILYLKVKEDCIELGGEAVTVIDGHICI